MSIDLKNSFTVGISSKFATNFMSCFSPHFKCVTILTTVGEREVNYYQMLRCVIRLLSSDREKHNCHVEFPSDRQTDKHGHKHVPPLLSEVNSWLLHTSDSIRAVKECRTAV